MEMACECGIKSENLLENARIALECAIKHLKRLVLRETRVKRAIEIATAWFKSLKTPYLVSYSIRECVCFAFGQRGIRELPLSESARFVGSMANRLLLFRRSQLHKQELRHGKCKE